VTLRPAGVSAAVGTGSAATRSTPRPRTSLALVDRLGDHPAALDWAREIARFAPLTLAYSRRPVGDLLEPAADDRVDVTPVTEWQNSIAAISPSLRPPA
jgi:hypothetical protein